MHPLRIAPAPGQESVWDYPRPPRLEATHRHLQVICNGISLAETCRGQRVLETSHPPVYYFPPEDIHQQYLVAMPQRSFCEWKGLATYYTIVIGEHRVVNAAWCYPQPTPPFAALRNHIAFYPQEMQACWVDGELVQPQPGNFYGGWITMDIVGPFKGEPGTGGW
ncbi:hypothetical protein DO97_15820 [Neosynechococcus sphagnicola sy1]|uniref:DUF427 domain-containing protein n=1 Tax=Neosynechococcus sphagnicola sy1 TaxID=1497020 RepID=A0A098TGM4_9CYAN|nr:DUF427 domain-containing protein [Neosynechococcus sphagnicola]KGF71745.1 hypothetical protein DO97_15820 [Neosynechococcus sphagnicola sy1]